MKAAIRLELMLILLAFAGLFITLKVHSQIPEGETWSVPDNESWRKARREVRAEYFQCKLGMALFPADIYPNAHEYFRLRADACNWAHEMYFGVPIEP